jgi:signal-transduction protein with cAMP-binding, CBS, and nucleotidyltransferase domain
MNLLESKHYDFLKTLSIFRKLSDPELKTVIQNLSWKEVKKDEIVFSRLEKERILYIVRYGSLKLEMVGIDDRWFKKGDVFGEVAFINNTLRTGTVKATESTLLFCLDADDLKGDKKIPSDAALKIVVELAKKITGYLISTLNTSTQQLIETGENEIVEFKSTLRYNLHTKKFGKEIEHAVLKTLAAFLNSDGGTLIIGVDDNRNILGLVKDGFRDNDHMLLHLTQMIKDRIGTEHTQFIKGVVEESNGNKVLRIDVKPATTPAYVTYNNEEYFYVRTGPATTELSVSKIYGYIKERFFDNK